MSAASPKPSLHTLLGVKVRGVVDRIVVWDTDDLSVGRAQECDVVLADSDLSRRHALFTRGGAGWFVEDLGTANGTLLNGEPLAERRPLKNKDVVRMGEVELTFLRSAKDPATLRINVEFASNLKRFLGGGATGQSPEATTLGLGAPLVAPDEEDLEVRPVGDFGFEGLPPLTRDLDLELHEPDGADSKLSLTLQIDGLSPELHALLRGLLGKEIALPALRVRIAAEDLD